MLKKGLLVFLILVTTGCSSMNLKDFSNNQPEFKIEEYFLGKTSASGLFIDLFGKVKRQFTVEMEGIQEGNIFIFTRLSCMTMAKKNFAVGKSQKPLTQLTRVIPQISRVLPKVKDQVMLLIGTIL